MAAKPIVVVFTANSNTGTMILLNLSIVVIGTGVAIVLAHSAFTLTFKGGGVLEKSKINNAPAAASVTPVTHPPGRKIDSLIHGLKISLNTESNGGLSC